MDQASTWGNDNDESNKLMNELRTVAIIPYAKNQLVKNLDRIGIEPEQVSQKNGQDEPWRIQKTDTATKIKFVHIFDAVKFCYVYHNRISDKSKWKCTILLEFMADAVIPQSFIRFREFFVHLPGKNSFVEKIKAAWNDPRLACCIGRLEVSGSMRLLDIRMRKADDELYQRLKLHPLFEHRLEDSKDSCYQKSSRFLTSNKDYAKDDSQKTFIATQKEFHRASLPLYHRLLKFFPEHVLNYA